jgi:hypothetical protein
MTKVWLHHCTISSRPDDNDDDDDDDDEDVPLRPGLLLPLLVSLLGSGPGFKRKVTTPSGGGKWGGKSKPVSCGFASHTPMVTNAKHNRGLRERRTVRLNEDTSSSEAVQQSWG